MASGKVFDLLEASFAVRFSAGLAARAVFVVCNGYVRSRLDCATLLHLDFMAGSKELEALQKNASIIATYM